MNRFIHSWLECRMTTRLAVVVVSVLVMLSKFSVLTATEDEVKLTQSKQSTPIDFNREIRPILVAKCFPCHGPDEKKREGDLRLDLREEAIKQKAIVPGDPQKSKLIQRIFSTDADERMPPADSNLSLTQQEKETLRRWIAAGAKYSQHWAFVPSQRPLIPKVRNEKWPREIIDYFVLSRLEAKSLSPSPEADRFTLARRLYLDLIGLPPTLEELDAFVKDQRPDSYEQLVDRLLASKQYGERWARPWLDLARYSDTNGYEKDRPRSIWPYRDWVIRALNEDMPFDQFTIEQLAGDMLPNASQSQKIATGFHRNTMLNEEGGIDPLEYRFHAMVDRVATTGTVWLGMTIGCAQCHSHKYDPISHTDYYRFMALLNNADEPDFIVSDPATDSRRSDIFRQIAELESELPERFPPAKGDGALAKRRQQNLSKAFKEWIHSEQGKVSRWQVIRPKQMETNLPKLKMLADGSILSTGDITKRDLFKLKFELNEADRQITALRLEVLPDDRLPAQGPGRAYYEGRKGDFFLSEVIATADRKRVTFSSASHSFGKISIGSGNANAINVFDSKGSTGWSTAGREGRRHQLVLNLAQPLKATGTLTLEMLFERHFAASLGRFRWSVCYDKSKPKATNMPDDVEQLLGRADITWGNDGRTKLMDYFLLTAPQLANARKEIDKLRRSLPAQVTTMVMQQRTPDNPRKTSRHHRGEYLSPREEVTAGIPAVFRQDDSNRKRDPKDRLELARWLVSSQNPLVGRVTVNRAWRALFGSGLMRTSGDFGTQSQPPSHPELLDWLAIEFMQPQKVTEKPWSMKRLHRIIVCSATYRQSSNVSPEILHRDPKNRLLAQGPRHRVDAETIRDIMLKATGLLSAKMYGPGVFPPQPASVTALAYGNTRWNASTGEDRFRRSLYTFSKRTAPFAASLVFDGPTGEECVAQRNRSNTPLQALTLLNDEMYLEMARALGKEVVAKFVKNRTSRNSKFADNSQSVDERRTRFVFRRFLSRSPTPDELTALLDYQQSQTLRLSSGELNPEKIADEKGATPELASWMMVVRAVMNLDETITKQ